MNAPKVPLSANRLRVMVALKVPLLPAPQISRPPPALSRTKLSVNSRLKSPWRANSAPVPPSERVLRVISRSVAPLPRMPTRLTSVGPATGRSTISGPPPRSVLRTWKPWTVVRLATVMAGPMLAPSTMGDLPLPKTRLS